MLHTEDMPPGRLLIIIGIALVVLGVLVTYTRIGRLPGDLSLTGKNFRLYFPLTTCIILSVLLTLIMWIFRK